MGVLMSDAMPLDSLLGATAWMYEWSGEWAYPTEAAWECSGDGADDADR